MPTRAEAISDYLRDAQWRISEITVQNVTGTEDPDLNSIRDQLYAFMDIAYVGRWKLRDAAGNSEFNFLENWTDTQVFEEVDKLRQIGEMNEAPFMSFAGYDPTVVSVISQSEAVTVEIPAGVQGEFVGYDASSVPIAVEFPETGGFKSGTITEYFEGRT